MRRSAPLRRYVELARRTPLRRIGKRGQRDLEELEEVGPDLFARSGGRCEFVDADTMMRCNASGITPHHVWPRGNAPPDSIRNDLSNLVHLCAVHHHWIHNVNPKAARRMGYLR